MQRLFRVVVRVQVVERDASARERKRVDNLVRRTPPWIHVNSDLLHIHRGFKHMTLTRITNAPLPPSIH